MTVYLASYEKWVGCHQNSGQYQRQSFDFTESDKNPEDFAADEVAAFTKDNHTDGEGKPHSWPPADGEYRVRLWTTWKGNEGIGEPVATASYTSKPQV